MDKEQPTTGGHTTTKKQENSGAGAPEQPMPLANKSPAGQGPQDGAVAGERHSEGSVPRNDTETLGTP